MPTLSEIYLFFLFSTLTSNSFLHGTDQTDQTQISKITHHDFGKHSWKPQFCLHLIDNKD